MKTRIQKWGNSLALRIPKSFAAEVGLEQDSDVEIALVNGRLLISRNSEAATAIEALLASMAGEERLAQFEAGPELSRRLGLQAEQKVQVVQYDNRIELIPVRKMRELRGFLRGIDTTIKREPDRL
jgi:antitoxin MazE